MAQQLTNLTTEQLINKALERKEGVLSANGALSVITGKRTGRSPKDRFIVDDEITHNTVDWGAVNQPVSPEKFEALWQKSEDYLKNKEHFLSELQVGEDPHYGLPLTVITEFAWHHLFAKQLFIRDTNLPSNQPRWTILSVPGLVADPAKDGTNSDGAVMLNFSARKVLIVGMRYAGEMKKAMFSVLNFLLPPQDVLPMHCAANKGEDGDVALFFGLSGTGKTTLSADPNRYLIGDDEHGWSKTSVFNFEGGCYAKCIDLSQKSEPLIWDAIRTGSIMENVVLDEQTKIPDYSDDSLTQNTRAAYPREFITKRVQENLGRPPSAVLFLCCDLYGVIPPISLLNKHQAAYYFLSGYTAKVGSTEVGGGDGVQPTFSRCFGAPFFPRPAQDYADLLIKRIDETNCQVYLVNTGWTGGSYGQGGQRFGIPTTRAIVTAAINGDLINAEYDILPGFNFRIPKHVNGVDDKVLDPRKVYVNKNDYLKNANELIAKFIDNFKQYKESEEIRNTGPTKIE